MIFTVIIIIIAARTAPLGLVEIHAILTIAVLSLACMLNDMLLPVRDLPVRTVAPKGQMGTFYGFALSALSLGTAEMPVAFGWAVDNGKQAWIFYASAALMLLVLATYTEARTEQQW